MKRHKNTTRGPLRGRYMAVLGEICVKMQNDKKTMFESVDTQEKRLLEMVGGYDNDVDVGMGDKKK